MSPSARQRVCVLGATGSIGTSTLDVLSRHPDRYEVVALSAYGRVTELLAQCLQWKPRFAVLPDAAGAKTLQDALRSAGSRTEVLQGPAALSEVASHADVDVVMAAIVGAAGLEPCLAAARAGKRLLLANKEAIVVGGALFMDAVREGGATAIERAFGEAVPRLRGRPFEQQRFRRHAKVGSWQSAQVVKTNEQGIVAFQRLPNFHQLIQRRRGRQPEMIGGGIVRYHALEVGGVFGADGNRGDAQGIEALQWQ